VDLDHSITCNNGTFQITADYVGGGEDRHVEVLVEGNVMVTPDNPSSNIPSNLPAGTSATIYDDNNRFNWVDDQDEWQIDGHGGAPDVTDSNPDFFVLNGTYDAVDARPDDAITVGANMYLETGGNGNPSTSDWNTRGNQVDLNGGASGKTITETVTTDNFWANCGIEVCVDGSRGVDALSFRNPDTGDCDPVRVCVDGQNFTVTEFEQQEGDLQTGDCVPFEETPPPPTTTITTTTTTLPPAAPVEQVAEAEVLPAALPSTGMGPGETSASFNWGAATAAGLLGLGVATALLARRRVS
jgi:hypothetical protein